MWWINANTFGREWILFSTPQKKSNQRRRRKKNSERKTPSHSFGHILTARATQYDNEDYNDGDSEKYWITLNARPRALFLTHLLIHTHKHRLDRRRKRNGFYDVTTTNERTKKKQNTEEKEKKWRRRWHNFYAIRCDDDDDDDNVMQRMRLIIFMIFLSHLF